MHAYHYLVSVAFVWQGCHIILTVGRSVTEVKVKVSSHRSNKKLHGQENLESTI